MQGFVKKGMPQGGERGGSVVECRTPKREVGGSKPTAAVLCPWARHFTPRKYWLITQEVVAPSRHDWKIVDWDVKPQHKQKACRREKWHVARIKGHGKNSLGGTLNRQVIRLVKVLSISSWRSFRELPEAQRFCWRKELYEIEKF